MVLSGRLSGRKGVLGDAIARASGVKILDVLNHLIP